jgi:DNA (cytosine-5)-methyltransferase 1
MAGFHHAAAVEIEPQFCTTLRLNRPHWDVKQQDIREIRAADYTGLDLVAAGVPCPPFSIAGKQLGSDDERDMFPAALEIVRRSKPRAVLFENVPGLASAKFSEYRSNLMKALSQMGYQPEWQMVHASDFGVPQLRPRFVLLAFRPKDAECFRWPSKQLEKVHVGPTLVDLMGENGWDGAESWAAGANAIAPTLVGGSKKHGGPDLGPTRAKALWRQLGVDGMGIADCPPGIDFPFDGRPRLTVRMVARIQSFPDSWKFSGRKTMAYRQVGNAFPPNVARAVGLAICAAFNRQSQYSTASFHSKVEMRLLDPPKAPCKRKKAPKL